MTADPTPPISGTAPASSPGMDAATLKPIDAKAIIEDLAGKYEMDASYYERTAERNPATAQSKLDLAFESRRAAKALRDFLALRSPVSGEEPREPPRTSLGSALDALRAGHESGQGATISPAGCRLLLEATIQPGLRVHPVAGEEPRSPEQQPVACETLQDAIDLLVDEERALAVELYLDREGNSSACWVENQQRCAAEARTALTKILDALYFHPIEPPTTAEPETNNA